jgi:MscS family membrane protein
MIARSALVFPIWILFAAAALAESGPWTGEWNTFWRGNAALLTLQQDGERVTGSYGPHEGRIEGTISNRTLSGTWSDAGAGGNFVFVLSEDGQTLTGQFENGEYWNGIRDDHEASRLDGLVSNKTPRETLRSIMIIGNAAVFQGDSRAIDFVNRLVDFSGEPTTALRREKRRLLMFQILNLSTFRIYNAPTGPDTPGGDVARFAIAPLGIAVPFELTFRQFRDRSWHLEIPSEETLQAAHDRFLAELGYEDLAALNRSRENSPRGVIRDFILGVNNWHNQGRERAMAVMDLGYVPERLREQEAPIIADYLKRVFDRIGYVIWQELPDDPDQQVPYVFYQHPLGTVTVARVKEGDETRWKLSRETLRSAPALLTALQDLPTAAGITEPEPLSPSFRLREIVRVSTPALVHRAAFLENWQWLGLAIALLVAAGAGWLSGRVLASMGRFGTVGSVLKAMASPIRILAAAVVLVLAIQFLGITQAGLPFAGSAFSVLLIIGIAFSLYRLTDSIGGIFVRQAEQTVSYVDEIASSLGTGLIKLLIIVTAIIACADVIGLPYEGVLTGLGVGGVALAFAARDTVSNMLGGVILMADRPFKRGDLVEIDSTLATVDTVGLRSTRLRALDDTVLHVPNSRLSDRIISNWGKRRKRRVRMLIGLTYDTPRDKFERFVSGLRDVYMAQPRADTENFYVGLNGFGASSIDIEFYGYFRVLSYEAQVNAQHALMLEIIALAEKVGVSFAFPTRTVHVMAPEGQGSTNGSLPLATGDR